MKLSEEGKKHFREVFEEKNSIIEYSYGIGWIPVKTKYELERIISADYNFQIVDFKPYGDITDFLDKQKYHGPYLIPINVQPKILKCPIEVNDEGVTLYNGYMESPEFVKYDVLKKYYTWQDDYPCGKF